MSPDRAALACLERAAPRLAAVAAQLEDRLQQGDDSVWTQYCDAVNTLARVLDHLAPGQRGEFLTTAEMARRLKMRPKTLLRHKSRGEITPVLQRGKMIRWRGDEFRGST